MGVALIYQERADPDVAKHSHKRHHKQCKHQKVDHSQRFHRLRRPRSGSNGTIDFNPSSRCRRTAAQNARRRRCSSILARWDLSICFRPRYSPSLMALQSSILVRWKNEKLGLLPMKPSRPISSAIAMTASSCPDPSVSEKREMASNQFFTLRACQS